MKTALLTETPWPANSSPNFSDYIPPDVQWMTENKDISTVTRGVQGGLQIFFSGHSVGEVKALQGQHFSHTGIPTTEIPHVTQSS